MSYINCDFKKVEFLSSSRPTFALYELFSSKPLVIILLSLLLCACEKPSTMDKINQHKTLHIITRNAPAVYYEGREGPAGFEYELARLFAKDAGLLVGISSGANIVAAEKFLSENNINGIAIIILADRGERYLSVYES